MNRMMTWPNDRKKRVRPQRNFTHSLFIYYQFMVNAYEVSDTYGKRTKSDFKPVPRLFQKLEDDAGSIGYSQEIGCNWDFRV